MRNILSGTRPFRHRNVRLYAWFTVFYNARAYYPIFAILFLDLGLSYEQFLFLNAIWAASIFLLEIPSGALADTIGRKKLIVSAALMMILEMTCLLFAPQNGGIVLFTMILLNRILSGASEAAVSGADQALAYDTLKSENEESHWDEVLAAVLTLRSAGFFSATILGALLYDPSIITKAIPAMAHIDRSLALRLPLVLVFLQSFVCLFLALKMKDTELSSSEPPSLKKAFTTTLSAAKWVFTTPIACIIIVGGVLADSLPRTFATLTSSYFRLIDLPTWLFGFLGALFAITGMLTPKLAQKFSQKLPPRTHLLLIITWACASLLCVAPAFSWYGIIPAIAVMACLSWTNFVTSSELNKIADSSQRATVLSVKGLAFNLGYGAASLGFAGAVAGFHKSGFTKDQAFQATLWWQPVLLLALLAAFFIWSKKKATMNG